MTPLSVPNKPLSTLHVVYDKDEEAILPILKREIAKIESDREIDFYTVDKLPGPNTDNSELWILPSVKFDSLEKVIKEGAKIAWRLDYKLVGTVMESIPISVLVGNDMGQMVEDAQEEVKKAHRIKKMEHEIQEAAVASPQTQKVAVLSSVIRRELEKKGGLESSILADSLKQVIELSESKYVDPDSDYKSAIVSWLKRRGINGGDVSFEATPGGRLKSILNDFVDQFEAMGAVHQQLAVQLGDWVQEQGLSGNIADRLREQRSAAKADSGVKEAPQGPGHLGKPK